MSSISNVKPKRTIRLWSVAIWILAWHGLSMYISHDILLVSPVSVAARLAQLVQDASFWKAILFSFRSIVTGFSLAMAAGILFAALAARFRLIDEFFAPAILMIKATPVASIIILVLLWVSSRNLSILISFLMVLPIIYTNVLNGIRSVDVKLLEMAKIFQIPKHRQIIYIYTSQVLPFFQSACSIALGLCWKSGIAAEVIGIPNGSIGENLYKSKVFLATADLFAWTLTIIIISVLFELLFMWLLRILISKLERS